jgi:hypothetical protein
MRAVAALPRLRRLAESRMELTLEVGAYGPWRYDETAGKEVRDLVDSFSTSGRIRARSAQSQRETDAGDRTILGVDRELHIPWNAPATPNGTIARVTAIGPNSDPMLAGVEFEVIGPIPGDQMTARRLLIREVQS